MPTFLSALSPLTLIVLLVFLFGVALVVALWSLLTLSSSPHALAVRASKVKKLETIPQPLSSNRFMKRKEPEEVADSGEDVESELPTDHVSRSRVRILKTLEPDPELETPAFKPTTYDQLVNRQRVPKTALPKVDLRKSGLAADSPSTATSKPAGISKSPREIGAPKLPPREANRLPPEALRPSAPRPSNASQPNTSARPVQPPPTAQHSLQEPLNIPTPPQPPRPPLRTSTEDTSTQPALFEAGKKTRANPTPQTPVEPEPPLEGFTPKQQPQPQKPRQASVQRAESEAAFRASQSSDTKNQGTPANSEPASTPKTQKEKDEAFENFLRKNDDLSF